MYQVLYRWRKSLWIRQFFDKINVKGLVTNCRWQCTLCTPGYIDWLLCNIIIVFLISQHIWSTVWWSHMAGKCYMQQCYSAMLDKLSKMSRACLRLSTQWSSVNHLLWVSVCMKSLIQVVNIKDSMNWTPRNTLVMTTPRVEWFIIWGSLHHTAV